MTRAATSALALAIMLFPVGVTAQSAQAQTHKESVLYSFPGGADGANPAAGLIFDAKGNLYGTTEGGGAEGCKGGCGTVFKVSSKGQEILLHSFSGADGEWPGTGLIFDAKGNLYGATLKGGAFDDGTVFKVSSKGHETVLHSFTGGGDGGRPKAGLILDAKGNLYGTTEDGGASGWGTVFKVDNKGQETVLYSFTGGPDGGLPVAGLILDAKGNLYGTTEDGGTSGAGVVFKVNSKGQETVLYSFTGGADGGQPLAGLVMDGKGDLYGTTVLGGFFAYGTVFKVNNKGQETVLYSFTGGADGGMPRAGLIFDAKGNLYGTNFDIFCDADDGCGTVFKVSSKGQETVLYSFTGGANGGEPVAGLIFDAKGNLYSTTFGGGASNGGTVFKVTP